MVVALSRSYRVSSHWSIHGVRHPGRVADCPDCHPENEEHE